MKLKKYFSAFTVFSIIVSGVFSYSLETLKESLFVNNPEIRGAEEEYNRAVLDYKDALAGFGPKIDLQLSGTYMVKPPVGSLSVNIDDILSAVQWPSGIKPASSGQYVKIYDGMENTLYSFQLSLEQPVFTWGKLHDAAALYKKISEIQKIKFQNTRKKLETELETRITSLWFLQKISLVLEEEQSYADEMISFSEDAEKSGMLLHQDVVEARIKAKELEIALQGVNEQITNQMIELRRITGISSLEFSEIDFEYDETIFEEFLKEDRNVLLERALSDNSDSVRMVSKARDVSDLALRISKDSVYWKPDVGLQMSMGYGGSRFPLMETNWLRKDDYSLNLSLGVKTTVWDGGKKLREVSRSLSNAESAKINEDSVKSTLRKTISEQWNTCDVSEIKIEYQTLKMETEEGKIKHQEVLFSNGYGSKADLLSVKMDLCNAEIEKLQHELSKACALLTISFLVN
ncbi:MAG: TolC family protein [Treponema sp.]|nr:TolC family protein [Treponema sp.]